ncbi:endonuclease/exonuclease/phosphatase family protein [Aliifodinibius sp. S!AR15-10]|uniref:endonuclease/exonuclease/phosphatase family protein n=1 Tax=Aliifodinibius sp. S!AR15-10 TaxID=2950437 RepID=UPI0028576210|nr:endonuclease/exonuclease/phosphatase family protein [Aliifodinibius sp. S!AR15-10]MDR8394021.1 endonuclease/exonuclease/phosphatase family protein [Aliifodinibius sp. S!AR15-10]
MVSYKLLSFLLLSIIMVSSVQAQSNAETEIRVMSYNIRYDNPDDGVNRWTNRRDRVASLIQFNKGEIIGLQEALHRQITWLDDRLEAYDWVGVGRTDGKLEGEFSPILYNAQRFEMLQNGTFWLSPTTEKPSKGWDAALPRICTWVRLKERTSGKEFLFFNTHFDHRGEQAREESAKVIMQKINEISDEATPVILTGDFNTQPNSAPYNVITKTLADAFEHTSVPHSGPTATYLDEGGGFSVSRGEGGRRIDYIFTNENVAVLRHGILSTFRDGRFPSDHLPVVADVTF